MWSRSDLQHAVERRHEHMPLDRKAEGLILAAERAAGRTEEVLDRAAAQQHLKDLLLSIKPETLPEHVRANYPKLFPSTSPAPSPAPAPAAKRPPAPAPASAATAPKPAPSVDTHALASLIAASEAAAKPQPSAYAPTQKAVSLEPVPTKEKDRSRGGPSR